jgi:hypothetical protein
MKLHTFTSHILNPFLTQSITKYSTTQSTIFFYYFTLLYFRTYIPRFLIVLLKLLYFLFIYSFHTCQISDLLYLRTHKSVFQLLSFYISFPPPKLILTQNKKIHRTYSGSTQSRKIYQIHKTYLSFTQSRKIPPSKLT